LRSEVAGGFPFFIEILILVLILISRSEPSVEVAEQIKSKVKITINPEANRPGHGHRAPSTLWQTMGCNFTPLCFSYPLAMCAMNWSA
jgi:hypothetical protein